MKKKESLEDIYDEFMKENKLESLIWIIFASILNYTIYTLN